VAAELLRRCVDRFHAPELNERFYTSGLFKTRAVSRLTRLTIASGVRAGANIAIMEINSYLGNRIAPGRRSGR
jgi:hypothetical protein